MYLALYRKWRPRSFSDVISQEHITTTLKNQVSQNRVAHAYIFTGSRGTGKTTCSRILAKAVNCLSPEDGEPCLKCSLCIGIEDESILDITEIDAASNNGVDNVRELRDEAGFTPIQCKYRIFIIDEVHMLSSGAFNALLKIMEEPPPHVIFILATTEIHKVPATILSRCQRFDFKKIRHEDNVKLLLKTAKAENISLTPDAAGLIAKISDGGMRDALSVLDQCMAFSSEIDENMVREVVGLAGNEYLFKFTNAVIQKNVTEALKLIDELYNSSKDLNRLCIELLQYFRNIMIFKVSKSNEFNVSLLSDEQTLRNFSDRISIPEVLTWINILQECISKLNRAVSKRMEFELCMIKMCTLSPSSDVDLTKRMDEMENKLRILIESGKTNYKDSHRETTNPTHTAKVAHITNEEIDFSNLKPVTFWADVLNLLEESDKPLAGVLNNSIALTYGDIIYIESPNPMFSMLLKKDGQGKRLMEAIYKHTGKKYRVKLKSGSTNIKNDDKNVINNFIDKANNLGLNVNEY